MVKFDQNIIEILNEYIPYIYDKSLDIDILELNIDYRKKADDIMYKINQLKEKSYNYKSKKIPNEHISGDINYQYNTYQLYMTWGALQIFYKNNVNNIDINVIDLHGLYQKEAVAILYILIEYMSLKRLKIITGRGNGILFNITQSVLKHFQKKYKILDNNTIIF